MSTLLSNVFYRCLRKAGITTLPGITPSVTQTTELIPELNSMMASWSIDGGRIFTTAINRYALTPSQTQYFIGPTGDFVAPRPIFIYRANVVVTSSSPEIHIPLHLATDDEWSRLGITELAGVWPSWLYNDGAMPDSLLYMYPFPTEDNDLELYTWDELKDDFTDLTDAVVFPPGYEEAIIDNFTIKVASMYPLDSALNKNALLLKQAKDAAWNSLQRLIAMNKKNPLFRNETANMGRGGNDGYTTPNIRSGNWGW